MDGIIPVLLAFFIVTVSPGPANIAVATVAMSQGRKRGIRFGLGLATGLAIWGLVAATGLGAILQTSEYSLLLLKFFGGSYLLWLAFQTAVSSSKSIRPVENIKDNYNWYAKGFLLNISNPKAVVAWMAALSMGMGTGDSIGQLVLVTSLCMILGVANYVGHAILFSYSTVMKNYNKFRRWIDSVVSGFFAIAGFSLLKSAFDR